MSCRMQQRHIFFCVQSNCLSRPPSSPTSACISQVSHDSKDKPRGEFIFNFGSQDSDRGERCSLHLSPTNSVDVGCTCVGEIIVDDNIHTLEIHPPPQQICCNKHPCLPFSKLFHCSIPLVEDQCPQISDICSCTCEETPVVLSKTDPVLDNL